MIRTHDIRSLTDFRNNAKEHLDRLAQTMQPEVLTVNGEAKGVVLAPAAFDELLADAEYARNLKAIRNGLEALKRGDTIPAEDAFAQVAAELGLGDAG
jgi:PHD/YefM family antitoxin component YafN of YafNO toxin-antitoxin module